MEIIKSCATCSELASRENIDNIVVRCKALDKPLRQFQKSGQKGMISNVMSSVLCCDGKHWKPEETYLKWQEDLENDTLDTSSPGRAPRIKPL